MIDRAYRPPLLRKKDGRPENLPRLENSLVSEKETLEKACHEINSHAKKHKRTLETNFSSLSQQRIHFELSFPHCIHIQG